MCKVFLLLFLVFLCSCSVLTEDEVVLVLPSETPLEGITGESSYAILHYYDGRRTGSLYVPLGRRDVRMRVRKASLSVFALQPAGYFSPFGAYHEPGGPATVAFSQEDGGVCRLLVDVAGYNGAVVSNLSLSALKAARGNLLSIDQEKFLTLLETGRLSGSSDIQAIRHEVLLENLPAGTWMSDKAWISDLGVASSGDPCRLFLEEGTYFFLNVEKNMLLILLVMKDGTHTVKMDRIPAWY